MSSCEFGGLLGCGVLILTVSWLLDHQGKTGPGVGTFFIGVLWLVLAAAERWGLK